MLYRSTSGSVSTEMGDPVLVQFPVLDSHPKPTQPSIPPRSVNEYQLWLGVGRQRQVWFIPLAERGVHVQVKM